MNKKNSMPAFSVLEALISMVVSAIVIGFVFVIFTILSEQMLEFKNQNQYVADLNRMTYSFNKDIFDSEKMLLSENQITFYSYSGEGVKYNLYPEYFTRTKNEFVDTFTIPIKQFRIDTIQNQTKKNVFQKLTLAVDVNKEPMKLKFFKKVYSNELIKKEFKEQ
jgi:hypothetical protein